MIPGTGLRNPVTMLPKFHSVHVPCLGHSSLEFVFVVYASVFWGVVWLFAVLWHFVHSVARRVAESNDLQMDESSEI